MSCTISIFKCVYILYTLYSIIRVQTSQIDSDSPDVLSYFLFHSSGGYRSQLLHIKNVRPFRSDEQGLVGKYRPDGQGQSEDPRHSVQHTQTSCGKSTHIMRGDLLDVGIFKDI